MASEHEDYRAIGEYIRKLAGTDRLKNARVKTGAVVAGSVSESARTCQVLSQIDEAQMKYTVSLSAENNDGFILIPSDESTVIFALLPNGDSYVLQTSDVIAVICYIDASNYFKFDANGFIWNGGSFGGMAKTGAVKTKLNNLETPMNQLIAAKALIDAAASGTPTAPVTNATLAAFFAGFVTTALTPTIQADIEDTSIKH